MNKRIHLFIENFIRGRFSLLLIALALLFLVSPLLSGDQSFVDKAVGVFMLAVLATCLRAISQSRRFFWFMLVFTLVNVGIGSFEIFSTMEPELFRVVVLAVRFVYFAVVFFSIMGYVLDGSPITSDKINGAISAYLLIGVAWSFIYGIFFQLDPASFHVPEQLLTTETVNSTWTLYFSFTTLTTLGYGDITPLTPAVQSYATMEAACGQIFLAVIIARLIALQIIHSHKK